MYTSLVVRLYFWIAVIGAIGASILIFAKNYFGVDILVLFSHSVELQICYVNCGRDTYRDI